MREDKRKRLEAKGWKVGTTQEFLRLTAEETAYIDLKVRLATSLRERRKRRRLTQADLAKLLRSSQSRVAKIEAGDPSVSLDLLIRSLMLIRLFQQATTCRNRPPRPNGTAGWVSHFWPSTAISVARFVLVTCISLSGIV